LAQRERNNGGREEKEAEGLSHDLSERWKRNSGNRGEIIVDSGRPCEGGSLEQKTTRDRECLEKKEERTRSGDLIRAGKGEKGGLIAQRGQKTGKLDAAGRVGCRRKKRRITLGKRQVDAGGEKRSFASTNSGDHYYSLEHCWREVIPL